MASATDHSTLEVLYEDNHLIAVNKQCGDIVQGDKTGDTPLSEVVKTFLKQKYDKPGNVFLGVVHRLDRPTSGVIVFAKTSKALSRMNKMFASGETNKTYWAVVQPAPKPEKNTLTHWLVRNPKQNKSYAYPKEVKDSKRAILHFETIKHLKSYSLLEIQLETGRHHQIRAQLAALGVHIKGDLKYGASRSNPDGGIHLHARRLSFVHPVSQADIDITAPTPSNAIWLACE
ncbi:MAG: RluA family pseudouridine synthase [Bacteroidota bacterium]